MLIVQNLRFEERRSETTLRHAQDLERVTKKLRDIHTSIAAEARQHDPVREKAATNVFRNARERSFFPSRPMRRVEYRGTEQRH